MKRFASDRVAGMMERLGLDEDKYIESGIVGKTIESAQTRVEGYNFDIRKRVVEFDDVINKQRETIYAERDKVLRNEDLTETIRAFLDEDLDEIVERHLGGSQRARGASTASCSALNRMGIGRDEIDPHELLDAPLPRGDRRARREVVADALEAKEAEVGEEWATIERFVLLRTIDSLWVEHLTELDDMRRGIGLRGYAQQDPLNEFRKEAFRLYEELVGFIRHQVASTIFRVYDPASRRRPPGVFAMPGRASRRAGGRATGAAGPLGRRGAGRHLRVGGAARRGGRPGRRPALRHGSGRAPSPGVRRPRSGRRRAGAARLHPVRREDRAQRCVLVRIRAQVQEVPRQLRRPGA